MDYLLSPIVFFTNSVTSHHFHALLHIAIFLFILDTSIAIPIPKARLSVSKPKDTPNAVPIPIPRLIASLFFLSLAMF
ncbi:hypothetical protein QUF99_14580 [Bacillus sp. DX4.1]|uniref:hypothetical protein n=1 Tax=Bacillus sp. DX4.1 TaxID=3055867 RepID=UPI0025A07517|nr:hypothetical protein [Bacillus sp. DX4.1]MDM5188496.1 hypothetical protein [Bacillus sp. DX4.1]